MMMTEVVVEIGVGTGGTTTGEVEEEKSTVEVGHEVKAKVGAEGEDGTVVGSEVGSEVEVEAGQGGTTVKEGSVNVEGKSRKKQLKRRNTKASLRSLQKMAKSMLGYLLSAQQSRRRMSNSSLTASLWKRYPFVRS
jgi:hypothetical protein